MIKFKDKLPEDDQLITVMDHDGKRTDALFAVFESGQYINSSEANIKLDEHTQELYWETLGTKKLWKYTWHGTYGNLTGLFIATDDEIEYAAGGSNRHEFQEITDDQDIISKLFELANSYTIDGYNPVRYTDIKE